MKKFGYILILSIFFVGCTTKHNIKIDDYGDIQQQADDIRKETGLQTSKVEILDDIEVNLNNGYVSIEGSVENVGSIDVEYFKVVIDFKNSSGNVLDSDYTINTSILKVGNQQKFEIIHKWDDKYENYTLKIEY